MKTIFTLLALMSISAYASDCTYHLTQWGVNGEHLSDSYVIRKIDPILEAKGYHYINSEIASYNVHLHYFGLMRTNDRSKTIGTILSFNQVINGKKTRLAETKNEKFTGPALRVSLVTLRKNINELADLIPTCETKNGSPGE